METLFTYVSPPGSCSYLPDQTWSLQYDFVAEITAEEYEKKMEEGWRRFGRMLFTPACPACQQCQSIRVLVDDFRPARSQKRAWKALKDSVRLEIGEPSVTPEKLDLYDRYHRFQSAFKDWPFHGEKDPDDYADSFVRNPFPTQEWLYYWQQELIGVGYVDCLPNSYSAIYFFYHPDYRRYSLGTFNVLSVIHQAQQRQFPYVYLGYFVEGCRSMAYKARFQPYQLLKSDGQWHDMPDRT